MSRLKLIWYALTAPKKAIEGRTAQIEFELDQAFIEATQKRLDAIKPGTWYLESLRVSSSRDFDMDAIFDFMYSAPATIQRLIDTVTPDEEDMQRGAGSVEQEMEGHQHNALHDARVIKACYVMNRKGNITLADGVVIKIEESDIDWL